MTLLPLLLLHACTDYSLNGRSDVPSGGLDSGLEGVPDIRVQPEQLDFGLLAAGERVTEVLQIHNQGSAALELQSIELASESLIYTLSEGMTGTLEPGEMQELLVTAAPSEEGQHGEQVWIESDDPDEPLVSVALSVELAASDCLCPEGFTVKPAQDGCERVVREEATQLGESYAVCPAEPYVTYNMYGASFPGGTVVEDLYWGQNDGTPNGRLNEVGVWACDRNDPSTAGDEPIDEWIGFAVCMEIAESGDYLLGLAADNRMRFYLDGVLLFERDSSDTANFNYWWMNHISLSSGTHIVEIHGLNDGAIASLGGEIAGPFPPGELVDDESMLRQDYDGSLVWSTAEVIGKSFAIGGSSGWSCPDGTTYDACSEEPQCVSIEELECL